MFAGLPKRHRLVSQACLAGFWLCCAMAGFGGAFLTPTTLTQTGEPLIVVQITGIILLAASLAAVVGVVFDKWEWEWVASWFAAAGACTYVVLVWAAVPGMPTRFQQAGFVAAALFGVLRRMADGASHYWRSGQASSIVDRLSELGDNATRKET